MQRIAIHSAPRSGSTWLGNIFNSHPHCAYRCQPLFSYSFKHCLGPSSTKQSIDEFFDALNHSDDNYLHQRKEIEEGIIPEFYKESETHLCYKEVRYHHILKNLLKTDTLIKGIGILRNPLSVLNSWLKAPKGFRKDLGWTVKDEWRNAPSKNQGRPENFFGFEKWKEVAKLFFELREFFPERFYLQHYRELLNNPKQETERVFRFCGLQMNPQTETFLQQSTQHHTDDAYSVFKNKTHDKAWKTELPQYIQDSIMADPEVVEWNKKFNWF